MDDIIISYRIVSYRILVEPRFLLLLMFLLLDRHVVKEEGVCIVQYDTLRVLYEDAASEVHHETYQNIPIQYATTVNK